MSTDHQRAAAVASGRAPCIIGVARQTWHPGITPPEGATGIGDAPEPLEMWEQVARDAALDSGVGDTGALLRALESVQVVYCQSWQYDDPAARLATRLGAEPAQRRYSGVGGSVPQVLAGDLATEILKGDLDLGLIVGAEALATRRRMAKRGERPPWSYAPEERRPFPWDEPLDPGELAHGIHEAYLTFALFDQARRAHLGRTPSAHRRVLGELLSSMTAVAADDPDHAWFPVARSAGEITDPSPDNRMVASPYTKLMTAIMHVDMASALVMASDERADALGIPTEQRVYLRSWAYAEDPPHVAQRRQLWRSPAMAVASQAALAGAGLGVDDLSAVDLYSCFASSVSFALDSFGLSDGGVDDRGGGIAGGRWPVTVIGGLPYHGGPGSNYLTHSIAGMVARLRSEPGASGLVSGVGMHMGKHVHAVWSSAPGPVAPPDPAALQAEASAAVELVPLTATATGPATIATYSVVHGRDDLPEWAALVCDLPDGSRCYARVDDPASLAAIAAFDAGALGAADDAGAVVTAVAAGDELVGRRVGLSASASGVNLGKL